ncbi:unnamed protein product [Soboliphyme baturini]|uniref:TGF-beta family profile domain-containing protein n=1 Tax=Soboliphyme baturini TaxID=241478 RepID=A0A183IEC4_9BILA|nr:unnamed protein product [Soboliphyme baturini]
MLLAIAVNFVAAAWESPQQLNRPETMHWMDCDAGLYIIIYPCPCVRRPESHDCISYDNRYQASTLEEAVMNFPDLTLMHMPMMKMNEEPTASMSTTEEPEATPRIATTERPKDSAGYRCTQKTCLHCTHMLTTRLKSAGMLTDDEFDQVRRRLGIPHMTESRECRRYRFSTPYVPELRESGDFQDEGIGRRVKHVMKTFSSMGLEKWNRFHSWRTKRALNSTSQIGTEYKIDCIKRGQPLDHGSDWLGLCNFCWSWRKLPKNFFPQFVNELVCDADTKCLSGWGMCRQRHKSIEVLQNLGTKEKPNYKPLTIHSPNLCDCYVKFGSAMHAFISA